MKSLNEEEKSELEKLKEGIKKLKKENIELKKRNKELEDYAKRQKAAFENYKREVIEEKKRIIKNANEYLVDKITQVLDDFDRAFKMKENSEGFIEGMKKIYKKLVNILENEGLSVINPEASMFNPFEHEAFEKVESDEHEEYSIVEVIEKGYKFHGKVLKPAKVKVAVKPAKKEEGGDN
ncbi:MAG: nucleotide exchange factor GrpE [Thermotogaceae bacterium]|nr:nucleotide exchange factor GrpE [Thermotogaceae bacterium]